jgi:hypothetical protein
VSIAPRAASSPGADYAGGQHWHARDRLSFPLSGADRRQLFPRILSEESSNTHQRIGGDSTGASNSFPGGPPAGAVATPASRCGAASRGSLKRTKLSWQLFAGRLTHRVLIQAFQPWSPRGQKPPGNPTQASVATRQPALRADHGQRSRVPQQPPATTHKVALSLIGYWALSARAELWQQQPAGCARRMPITPVTGQAQKHQPQLSNCFAFVHCSLRSPLGAGTHGARRRLLCGGLVFAPVMNQQLI